MADVEELDALSSRELHDRAVSRAVRHADVRFLWRLLKAIPAAEAGEGRLEQGEADLTHVSALLNELVHSGEGSVADGLRPIYIEYLTEHPGDS